MAFDAAVSAAPPARPAAQGAAKGAAATPDAQAVDSPFGALMALWDSADTPDAPQTAPAPVQEKADAPSAMGAAAEADANADEVQPEAAPDPATLAALMMAAPPPPPVQATAPAPVEAPTAAPPAAPVAAAVVEIAAAAPETIPLPEEGVAPPAAAAPKAEAKPAEIKPVEAKPNETAAVAQPKPQAQAGQAASPPPVQTAEPVKAAEAVAATEAAPAAVDAKPTTGDVRRAEVGARDAATQGVAGPAAPDGEGAQGETSGEHRQDRSHSEALAQADGTAAPFQSATTPVEFAAAPATPDVAAPAASAQPAPAAPVITAQAAAVPVRGSPETVAHLAAQLVQKLDGQTTRFDLALNPQSLGRVDVRIEIDRRGALKAHMSFDNPAAAQDLGGRQAELRAALQSAGFDIAEGALSFDVASGGSQGRAFDDSRGSGSPRMFEALAQAADPAPATPYLTRAATSGVDIRV